MKLLSVPLAAALGLLSASPASTADLTPAQLQAVDRLVGSIKRLSRTAFARESWQSFAALYNPESLACDPPWETHGPYSYLSIRGIPETAQYRIGPIEEFALGGVDTSRMGASHYVEITYRWPWLAKCGKADALFVREHFYLRPAGNGFELTHYCRGTRTPPPPDARRTPPMVSARWASSFVETLSAAERSQLRRSIVDAPVSLHGLFAMQDRYRISERQAQVAMERLCELESSPKTP
jgi:hypothetical protein